MYKYLKLSIYIVFFGYIPICLNAQNNLRQDLPFFHKKLQLYRSWLSEKQLDSHLQADTVILNDKEDGIELFLCLKTHDPDTAASLWTELKTNYAGNYPADSLGAYLFFTFVRLMEIDPGIGNLQVYFKKKDTITYSPCFYVWYWEENGELVSESNTRNCKVQNLEIKVNLSSIPGTASDSVIINIRQKAEWVFDRILKFANNHYGSNSCEGESPSVERTEQTEHKLSFIAEHLCQEVLTEQRKSLWCQLVSRWMPCNDMRRERLEFTFYYIPTEEGYLLSGQLTGKFGSGVYRPRSTTWMDMEPDFEADFLVPYVRRFQQQLHRYLTGK